MPIVTDGMAILPSIVRTIEIRTAENILDFVETDQVDPVGRWRFRLDGDKVYLERATAASWGSDEDWLVCDKANEKLTYPKDIEGEKNIAFKSGTGYKVTFDHAATADRTITIPDADDTMVLLTLAQTLANKTLTTPIIAQIYQDSGKTNLLTLPAATDTLVGRGTTDTLTNKTLTSPTIQGTVGAGTGLTMPAFTAGGVINANLNAINSALIADILTSQPTADATQVGRIIGVRSGAGVATTIYICVQNSADGYEWVQLAVST